VSYSLNKLHEKLALHMSPILPLISLTAENYSRPPIQVSTTNITISLIHDDGNFGLRDEVS